MMATMFVRLRSYWFLILVSHTLILLASDTEDPFSQWSQSDMSYRRSPQCTAKVEAMPLVTKTVEVESSHVWGYTITDLVSHTTVTKLNTNWIETSTPDVDDLCCGVCNLDYGPIDMFYWPQPEANYDCLSTATNSWTGTIDIAKTLISMGQTAANTANIPIPFQNITSMQQDFKRDFHTVTAVDTDGFTYTSPYNYMKIKVISANDRCGQVGGIYTSITWSFLPGEISTYQSPKFGGEVPKSFNFADLPCPPKSVILAAAHRWDPAGGELYAPKIAPPPQIKMLDKAFRSCTWAYLPGHDPPIALTQEAQMATTTSSSIRSATTTASTGPDYPGAFKPTPAPTMEKTHKNHPTSTSTHSKHIETVKSKSIHPSHKGEASSKVESSPASKSHERHHSESTEATPMAHSSNPEAIGGTHLPQSSDVSYTEPGPTAGSSATSDGDLRQAEDDGANIISADTTLSKSTISKAQKPSAIDSASIPSNEGALQPGGPNDSEGNRATKISHSTETAENPKSTNLHDPSKADFEVGGQSATLLSSGIALGSTVLQAGQIVTVEHATFSYASDGRELVAASSTVDLESLATAQVVSDNVNSKVEHSSSSGDGTTQSEQGMGKPSQSTFFTIASHTIIPQSVGVVIASNTLLPGSKITDGTEVISLASDDGGLVVGTQTIALSITTSPDVGDVVISVWQGTKTVFTSTQLASTTATSTTSLQTGGGTRHRSHYTAGLLMTVLAVLFNLGTIGSD